MLKIMDLKSFFALSLGMKDYLPVLVCFEEQLDRDYNQQDHHHWLLHHHHQAFLHLHILLAHQRLILLLLHYPVVRYSLITQMQHLGYFELQLMLLCIDLYFSLIQTSIQSLKLLLREVMFDFNLQQLVEMLEAAQQEVRQVLLVTMVELAELRWLRLVYQELLLFFHLPVLVQQQALQVQLFGSLQQCCHFL